MIGGGECLSPHYLTLVSWFYKEVQNEHKTFIRFQGNIIVLLFSTTFIAEKKQYMRKIKVDDKFVRCYWYSLYGIESWCKTCINWMIEII
jgi:hypothetical protein